MLNIVVAINKDDQSVNKWEYTPSQQRVMQLLCRVAAHRQRPQVSQLPCQDLQQLNHCSVQLLPLRWCLHAAQNPHKAGQLDGSVLEGEYQVGMKGDAKMQDLQLQFYGSVCPNTDWLLATDCNGMKACKASQPSFAKRHSQSQCLCD